MGWAISLLLPKLISALAQTDFTGDLNYSERKSVRSSFRTIQCGYSRFHETWNGISQRLALA